MHKESAGQGLVCERMFGQPSMARALRTHLRSAGVTRPQLFERSEINRPIRRHDLRATCGTWLAVQGKAATEIRDVLGHTETQMTDRSTTDNAPNTHVAPSPTSLRIPEEALRACSPATLLLAESLARHYALKTGRLWKTIDPGVLALVAPFVEEMRGPDDAKLARACTVIDDVVAHVQEQTGAPPTLRYIFHPQIF
jgi:hypothetical protein